ncbi:MAG: hypothetical protein K2P64_05595 [Lachnospiraceae bacterium]|nr:hypothetical protein [Lachnospiraceae bacterium]
MNTELKAEKNLLLELEEAEKVNMTAEDNGTYSITVDFGGYYTIICC